MLLLLLIIPLVIAQNLYGPSQLDQYARLINSGNLGGFGFFQHALTQGTLRGLGDLNAPQLIAGLPPLPLTYEEVMKQLTSTPHPTTTRATAIPTTPSTFPGGIYAVNTMVELPPMPESRIQGTYDDDGVFHPFNEEKKETSSQIIRNQIQGTKIRDFSQTERDAVDGQVQDNANKVSEYEDDATDDEPTVRVSSNARSHQLAQRSEQMRQTHQNPSGVRQRLLQRQIKYHKPEAKVDGGGRSKVTRNEHYPLFVFRPKPPPPQRQTEYNNLLAEIEEYDDFLEEQRLYLSRYPQASLPNPYRELPPGQLPSAGAYSEVNNVIINQAGLPPPTRISSQSDNQPTTAQPWLTPIQRSNQAGYSSSTAENPLLNIFNLFSFPHAHALAAPQLNFDRKPASSTSATTLPPRTNPYQLGILPFPMQGIPLVDIQQQPLSFPQPDSPLVLMPLFSHGN